MTADRAVEWMAERGRTGYRERIATLTAAMACPMPSTERDTLAAMIEEEKRDALDRYEDWASDPLP